MIKVTLLVKEGDGAKGVIQRRLNRWFTAGPLTPAYPPGTLLSYSIHDEPEQEGNT